FSSGRVSNTWPGIDGGDPAETENIFHELCGGKQATLTAARSGDLKPDGEVLGGEAGRDRDGGRSDIGEGIDDGEPFDIVREFVPVAFGDITLFDRERRHDCVGTQYQIIAAEELTRPREHDAALHLGARDLGTGELEA